MKKRLIRTITFASLLFSLVLFSSCYQPNPLTGTWASNKGDQLTLFPDYNYSAKIVDFAGDTTSYSGTYNVLMNAISFTASDGYTAVSEWDIRGGMFYLEWTDRKGKKLKLTLYKTKN